MKEEYKNNVTQFLKTKNATKAHIKTANTNTEAATTILAQYTQHHPAFILWGYWRDL